MSISIKNFVNTEIDVLSRREIFSGFRTTIYMVSATIILPDVESGNFVVLESMDGFDDKVSASAAVRQSVEEYFRNGGTKLCLCAPSVFTFEGFKEDLYKISKEVDDYFFVCLSDNVTLKASKYDVSTIYSIATFGSGSGWSDADKKVLNKIRICLTSNSTSFVVDNDLLDTLVAVKYSTLTNTGELVDAALLIGAYFSQIDVNYNDAIKDYNFTSELLGVSHFEDVNQATFILLNNNQVNGNYNFIGKVANRVVNIGGDYVSPDKLSMSLDFGVSCIERDLNFAMIERMFGKLPLTQEGQSKLIDAIRVQLNKYVDNEFLDTDSLYGGETTQIIYNGAKYTVISNGDILPLGYRVFFVPINAISAEDRSAKRFPYIFIALQSVHGARLIQVNGSIL